MTAPDTARVFRFGRCEWWPDQRRLRVDGRDSGLGARALDLLQALIERRDRVATKDELLAAAWPGRVVEEANLGVQVAALRKVVGPDVIATVAGRGYRFVAPLQDGPDTPVAPLASLATGAPIDPTLVGRAAACAELAQALALHRLVTLVGPGGVGKTRLAAAVAPPGRPGIAWVDLAVLPPGAPVPRAVAQALRLPAAPDTGADAIAQAVSGRIRLLVLDNGEHVAAGAAAMAAALLRTPDVRVLVTSQVTLHLPEEQVIPVAPLEVGPGATGGAAVELFVARARAADARFEPDPRDCETLAAICRRLDGLPLAIELAAARVRLLGVDGVHQRLDERLRLYASPAADVPDRHRTLRAALAWSHGLLGAAEQAVLRRMAVCAGGCTLEVAQAIAGDDGLDAWAVLDALSELVDRSLVVVDATRPVRYRLFDSVRLLATEQLERSGERDRVRERHARVFAQVSRDAEEADYGEGGDGRMRHLQRLVSDLDNLRQALEWALAADDAPLAITLAARSARAYYLAGAAAEVIATMRRLLPRVEEATPHERVVFLAVLGNLGSMTTYPIGPLLEVKRQAAEAARAAGGRVRLHRALISLGAGLVAHGDTAAAAAIVQELETLERPGDPPTFAAGRLSLVASAHMRRFEVEPAIAAMQAQRALLTGVPDAMAVLAPCEANLSAALNVVGRHREALDIAARAWAEPAVARTLVQLVYQQVLALAALGRPDAARALAEAERPALAAGPAVAKVGCEALAELARCEGRLPDALRIEGALLEHISTTNTEEHPLVRWLHQRLVASCRDAGLDDAEAAAWRAAGAQLSSPALLAICLARTGAATTDGTLNAAGRTRSGPT